MSLGPAAHAAEALKVRPAVPGDLQGLLKIADSTPELPRWTPAHYESLLKREASPLGRQVFAGTVLDEVVVFGVLSLLTAVSPPEGEIENLGVSPQWRRQGIGRAMLLCLLDCARASEAVFVDLEVRAGNTAALALYAAAGFVAIGRRTRYYREPVEDAVLLRVHLSSGHEASGMIED